MPGCTLRTGSDSHRRTLVLAGWLIVMGVASVANVPAADLSSVPDVEQRLNTLREGSWAEMDAAVFELAQMGELAIPALASCLEDPAIRSACADILTRMQPDLAVPPLEDAIDRAPAVSTRERNWKAFLIAGLGRLRSSDSVSYLEALYEREDDKNDRVATSIAWALKNVTGSDYGPAHDPWVGCAQYVGPPEAEALGSRP